MFTSLSEYREFVAGMTADEHSLWENVAATAQREALDRHGYPVWRIMPQSEPALVYADWLEENGRREADGLRALVYQQRVLLGWSQPDWTESATGDGYYWSREGDASVNCWDRRNELPAEVFRLLPEFSRAALPEWEPLYLAAAWAFSQRLGVAGR